MTYLFLGTTAEYIKLIPVILALKKKKKKYRIILSGQTKLQLSEFEKITGPQHSFHTFNAKGTRSSSLLFAVWSLRTLWQSFLWGRTEFLKKQNRGSTLIVQGDTVSAFIGAFVGRLYGLRIVHIEAGLRTFNLLDPFPEEICRTFISFFTSLHFTPTKNALKNLKRYPGKKVTTFYNTSVEALELALKKQSQKKTTSKYFLFILHRQEHLYLRKAETQKLIETVFSNATKQVKCLFLVHDVTSSYLKSIGMDEQLHTYKNVEPVARQPFLKFVELLNNAEYLITDGGGNHTECYYLGKPCLILRKKSEQTEGVGENIVVGESLSLVSRFMKNYKKYKRDKLTIAEWPSAIIMNTIFK